MTTLLTDAAEDMADDSPSPQATSTPASVVSLSKSWSVSSTHEPTYTGGPITHCHTRGLLSVAKDDMNDDDDEEEDVPPQYVPFLVLPVNGDLMLVDARKGTKIRTIRQDSRANDDEEEEEEGVDGDEIMAYALSWNDQMLLTCSRNQLMKQYSLQSADDDDDTTSNKKASKSWGKSGHSLPVVRIQFHKSNCFVATASVDGTVRIWDVRGAFVTHVFRPYASSSTGGLKGVSSIQWKANTVDLIIAIGREDGSIAIHDLRDEEDKVIIMQDHDSAVTCLDWAPSMDGNDEEWFCSTGRDSVLNLWKYVANQEAAIVQTKKKKKKKKSGTSAATYKRMHTKPMYEQVEGMAVLPSSSADLTVAIAGSKGLVRLFQANRDDGDDMKFDCISEQPTNKAFGEQKGGYMDLKFHPRSDDTEFYGQGQLIVADAEHNLQFLSLAQERNLLTTRTIVGQNDEILDLKLVPNGPNQPTHAVVATNSAQVRLFSLDTFSCEILDGHTATVLCVDVSPCGRFIATSGKDKSMRIWLVSKLKCVALATGHTEAVGAAALSRKIGRYEVTGKAAKNGGGSFVVTASKDRTIKRWNLPGAAILEEDVNEQFDLETFCSSRAHEKDINIVSIAPNDSLVATGSQDKTVKIWDTSDLSLRATLKGHKRGVWDCQFSPFDRVLATASGDRSIKLWSLNDYSCVRTFQGHVASVLRVRFLTAGLQLVSSGADGLVKLWTIRTNECEVTMDSHQDKVWALDLSEDGKMLVSGGADSQILVWGDTTKQVERAERLAEEENILLEQRLANHLRHKEFQKALEIALDLDKPRQVLKVLNSIAESEIQKGKSGLEKLQEHARKWSMEKVKQILKYCRDWNTRARNSHIAMLVVQAIVTCIPVHKLAQADGIPEIMAGITPYAERHFDRLDRLYTNTFILDYTLFNMGVVDDDGSCEREYANWESKSKLVLPPNTVDGRIQIGGMPLVGRKGGGDSADESDDEIVTIGDSSSDESSDED